MTRKRSGVPSTEQWLPRWFWEELRHVIQSGVAHALLLYGDTHSLFPNPDRAEEPDEPYLSLKRFLEKALDARDMVMFYNIAAGLSFLRPDMDRRFRSVTGLDQPTDPSDPVAAARASLVARQALPREPDACLPLIEKVLQRVERSATVIQSVHTIAPVTSPGIPLPANERANIERLKNWAQDETIKEKEGLVLFITDQAGDVHRELRLPGSLIQPLLIPKPSQEERKTFTGLVTRRKSERPKGAQVFPVSDDFAMDGFVRATQGMNLRQLQELFLRARERNQSIDLDYVKARKQELLNQEYGDVMEVVEPKRGLEDIGGYDHIKSYFHNVLDAIRRGEPRLVPMGVTLMGPPGTGKTALVEALAKEAGFNFVKTRNVRSMWVGESESRMEKLLAGLRGLAPVVVMNDEADLAEGGRDAPRGDSGVSERLMKMWMELLSDPRIRGEVIVISCTNRPDRIDPALKRSGRSDERILLPLPSWQERVAILQVLFRRHAITTDIPDFSLYAEDTDGMSGADLEKMVLCAYRFAVEAGKGSVDDGAMTKAIRDFIPGASQADIDRMTLVGILECSSRRLLPVHIRDIVAQIKKRGLVEDLDEWLEKIHSRRILESDN